MLRNVHPLRELSLSEARSIGAAAPTPQVQAAIAGAARATGTDFSYLLGEARLESSLNPNAQAGTSSAAGLYQFTGGTWLATLERHGAQHGLGWASAAISGGRVRDPAMRQQIMALRFDPQASALMAGELANDNRAALTTVLGRTPDPAELYLAHFLGADGAGKFLTNLAADPAQSAAALFPQAAAANHTIFFDAQGAPRSLGAVMGLLRGKLADAMGEAPAAGLDGDWAAFQPGAVPDGESFTGQAAAAVPAAPRPRPSMADTLAATFGGSAQAMPVHVRQAYGQLRAFGL